MLSTKTYLEWPQQANQQPFFWAQLRSVLGKPTVTREGNRSIRSNNSSLGIPVNNPPVEGNRPDEDIHGENNQENVIAIGTEL